MDNLQEALAQLRDIHDPQLPGFWPIPLGWWVVIGLLVAMLLLRGCYLIIELRRRRPYKRLKAKVKDLRRLRLAGELSPLQYATGINLIYKELLVAVEHRKEAARLHGRDWLDYLSERFSDTGFSEGSGRCLGAIRYLPGNFSDEGLNEVVDRTLMRAKYKSWRRPGTDSG